MKTFFFAFATLLAFVPYAQTDSSSEIEVIYSDIPLFWNTYDQLLKETNPDIRAKIVKKQFFTKGSKGLRALIKQDKIKPDAMANLMLKTKFFNSIRQATLDVMNDKEKIVEGLKSYQRLYPEAKFKPIYFTFGLGYHGGTVNKAGLILEIEKNVGSHNVDYSEMEDWFVKSMIGYEGIASMTIHEQVHYSQEYRAKNSLLGHALKEGSCDFIMYHITKKLPTQTTITHNYANENEELVWKEFQEDSTKPYDEARKRWFYNYRSKDRVPDLGYYIGFKISEAYYNQANDKSLAIKEIININDFDEFLLKSGYRVETP
ncbi:MAG: hypothetical protein AB8B73_12685 [Ekhidna sp.]